jgi:2-dehydro-3-deoxy-D-arabinonate dehydratase
MKLFRHPTGWHIAEAGQRSLLPNFDIDHWLSSADPETHLASHPRITSPTNSTTKNLLPLNTQEIWAAGVTYLRSKTARMEESRQSATAYDRVYDAPRPEIFFKATPRRCAADGEAVHLRDDSKWMVPEPELALVVAANRQIVGYTIADDLSCRDIEGENALYLPQAKIWDKCCAVGPAILVADRNFDVRSSTITLTIRRDGAVAFTGSTPIARIKRTFDELVAYLFRNHTFPTGVLLLTGTGIVPPDDFTLRPNDEIQMHIPEIGTLTNATL